MLKSALKLITIAALAFSVIYNLTALSFEALIGGSYRFHMAR